MIWQSDKSEDPCFGFHTVDKRVEALLRILRMDGKNFDMGNARSSQATIIAFKIRLPVGNFIERRRHVIMSS